MSLIYVFAASRVEGRPVERLTSAGSGADESGLGQVRTARTQHFRLIVTGMGPRNAEARARGALGVDAANDLKAGTASKQPDAAIVIGWCGALSRSVGKSAIVAYTEALSTEAGRLPLPCARNLRERITNLLASRDVPCELVVGITSSRIATTPTEKLNLAQTGASVVDMESYAILSAAADAGVPAVVLRVVSDALDTRIPDFNRALTAQGRIKTGKAARIALRHPLQTAGFLLTNRRSMEKLSQALEIVLKADAFANLPLSPTETLGSKS